MAQRPLNNRISAFAEHFLTNAHEPLLIVAAIIIRLYF